MENHNGQQAGDADARDMNVIDEGEAVAFHSARGTDHSGPKNRDNDDISSSKYSDQSSFVDVVTIRDDANEGNASFDDTDRTIAAAAAAARAGKREKEANERKDHNEIIVTESSDATIPSALQDAKGDWPARLDPTTKANKARMQQDAIGQGNPNRGNHNNADQIAHPHNLALKNEANLLHSGGIETMNTDSNNDNNNEWVVVTQHCPPASEPNRSTMNLESTKTTMRNAVCFGLWSHPGTKKWRTFVQAFRAQQHVSSWSDDYLVEQVKQRLRNEGISEYYIQTEEPMTTSSSGGGNPVKDAMKRDQELTFSANWRKATEEEILDWTKRLWSELQSSGAQSMSTSSSSSSSLSNKRRRESTRPSTQASYHRRRRRHYPKRTRIMVRDSQYPMIAMSVCFGWKRHPGTILWRNVVNAIAEDVDKYPGWNDSMIHVVKNELGKDNVAIYLVFRNENDEACNSIDDGLWVSATMDEIVQATKDQFERCRYQRLNDLARHSKQMQSESSFPRNVGAAGPPCQATTDATMSHDAECSDVSSSEDDGSGMSSNEDSCESSENDDDDDEHANGMVIDAANGKGKGETPVVLPPAMLAAKAEPQTVVSPVSNVYGNGMAKQMNSFPTKVSPATNVGYPKQIGNVRRAEPSIKQLPRSFDVDAQIRVAIGPQEYKKASQNTTGDNLNPTPVASSNVSEADSNPRPGKSECFGWVKRLDSVDSGQTEQRRENAIKNYFRFSPSCSDHACNRMKRALEVWGIYFIGCIDDSGLVLEQAFEDHQFPGKWRMATSESILNGIKQRFMQNDKAVPAPKDLQLPNRDDRGSGETMKQLSTILRAVANLRTASGTASAIFSHDKEAMLNKAPPDIPCANYKHEPGQTLLPSTNNASSHMTEKVWSMSTLMDAVAGIQVDQEVRQALVTLVQACGPHGALTPLPPTATHGSKQTAPSQPFSLTSHRES